MIGVRRPSITNILCVGLFLLNCTFAFLCFFTLRDLNLESIGDQTLAVVDAEYYSNLIDYKISKFEDIFVFEINPETNSFMALLLLLKKIGVNNYTLRSVFNSCVMTLVIINILKNIVGSWWKFGFVLSVMPIGCYGILASKEFFVVCAALIIFWPNKPRLNKLTQIIALTVLTMARPIMGLVFVGGLTLSALNGKKLITTIVLGLLVACVFYNELIYKAFAYQQGVIENDPKNYEGVYKVTMLGAENILHDLTVILTREVVWFPLRLIRSIVGPAMALFGIQDLLPFEYYFEVVSACAASMICYLLVHIAFKFKIRNLFSVVKTDLRFQFITLVLFALITAGFAFYQTQRIFLLVYPMVFLMSYYATNKLSRRI